MTDPLFAALAELKARGGRGERAALVREGDPPSYRVVAGSKAPAGTELLATVGVLGGGAGPPPFWPGRGPGPGKPGRPKGRRTRQA